MKSAPAIAFDFRPCPYISAATATVAMLALFGIALCGLDNWLKLVLAILAIVLAALGLRGHLLPGFTRMARGEGGWLLVGVDGNEQTASLHAHVRRGPLLVLDMRDTTERRLRIVLTPGNSDAELRRRLILILAAEPGNAHAVKEV